MGPIRSASKEGQRGNAVSRPEQTLARVHITVARCALSHLRHWPMLARVFGMGRFVGPMRAPAHDAAEQQQGKADLGSLATASQRAVPPGYIHLGVAKGIYAVLNELGADPDEVIAGARLDPSVFDHPDSQIPVSALGRLV